ncbi:MAG: zinc ribbon domain-containing protein [Anaerolineales bacterium]|jgi:hypothetical protein|nr:zinc ribbon domain-containing protein [Anaerolineales bacterium]
MRKLIMIFILGAFLAFPFSVSAQGDTAFSFVTVQLWPEYDQPSMLVIVDFQAAADTALPATLSFRIPADANLIAVASDAGNGQFLDHPFEAPVADGEYLVFSLVVEENKPYRFEYYQPLAFDGESRIFSYLWDNGYAVENFQYLFLEPLDVTNVTLEPTEASQETSNGLNYYQGAAVPLAAGEQYTLNLNYKKTTETLVSDAQAVQIAEPVNEDTPGRVSLANSLPYIIGGLGIIMIAGGLMYYFQWGRRSSGKPRRRSHANVDSDATSVYCPQCGSRAKPTDRFCRTCGARLRHEEG